MPSSARATAAALFLALLAAPAAAADRITVEAIQARLLYEGTGVLSQNIAPPAKFYGFNTVVGEGDAKEPASDVLITVVLAASGEANGDGDLVVTAKGAKGRTIASRTFAKPYIGNKGKAHLSMIAPNATCDELVVTATYGKSRKSTRIEFHCGE